MGNDDKENNIESCIHNLIDLMSSNIDLIRPYRSSRWSNSGWETPNSATKTQFEIKLALSGTRYETMRGQTFAFQEGDLHFHDCEEESICHQGIFTYAYIIFTIDPSIQSFSHIYPLFARNFREIHVIKKKQYNIS